MCYRVTMQWSRMTLTWHQICVSDAALAAFRVASRPEVRAILDVSGSPNVVSVEEIPIQDDEEDA